MYCHCPVNGALDTYHVSVEANRMIKVEDILAIVAAVPEKMFQEDITAHLAAELCCGVTTTGYHSGVKTTCVC